MSVFTNSISDWVHNISINSVIMMIMMIFMLVGAIDKIRGNKKGYGEKFERDWTAGDLHGRSSSSSTGTRNDLRTGY